MYNNKKLQGVEGSRVLVKIFESYLVTDKLK